MNYAIGADHDGLTELIRIAYGGETFAIPPPFPATYLPYTRIVGQNGQGGPIYMGPPTLTWHWNLMLKEWYNFFLSLLGSNLSATVNLRTKLETGEFQEFTAVMWFPTSTPARGQQRSNVDIKFTQLSAV